jgi:hypothetical protein
MFSKPAYILLLGGLVVDLVDGLDAIVFFGFRGVTATQIMQTIASGLLGPGAYQGGMVTAALGVGLPAACLPAQLIKWQSQGGPQSMDIGSRSMTSRVLPSRRSLRAA